MFYIAPGVGPTLSHYVRELVSGDTRSFLPVGTAGNSNYSEDTALVSAVECGAYWDILRRTRTGR